MESCSRTTKSVRNVRVALIYYFVNLLLQFFSRKVFLDFLGAEILGLNTTATNLLQFLNLAELGIGVAVGYSLYRPLAAGDRKVIHEIVSIQGFLYRRIGWVMLGAAAVLMCFFPWFFAKIRLPLWYTYATFGVLLGNSLAGFFFNYRQIVLTADQKEYKLTLTVQSIKTLKVLLQMLAIIYLPHGYLWWLGLELAGTVVSTLAIDRLLKREYGWLHTDPSLGKMYRTEYPQIITKTKQLFFHKIASYALTQTSPLIIYAYTTLTLVAIYGNYALITVGTGALLNAVFNGVAAGVGNLVAEGDRNDIRRVFRELFSARFLAVVAVCFGVYVLATPFIDLWVGKQYLLDGVSLFLIVLIMYFNMIRQVVDSFINAYGLFHDVWAPIAEAVLNVGLSVLFGYWWGLPGVLSGVACSQFLIVFLWKPYFLFREGMHERVGLYVRMYAKHVVMAALAWTAVYFLLPCIPADPAVSFAGLALYGILAVGCFSLLLLLLLYASETGMRDFIGRAVRLTKR